MKTFRSTYIQLKKRRHAHRRPQAIKRAALLGTAVAMVAGALAVAPMVDAATPTTVANDTFQRVDAGTWGAATVGGTYNTWVSAGGSASVHNGGASFSLGAGQSGVAKLPSVSAADVDVQGTLALSSIPVGGGFYHAWEMRLQPNGNCYRGRIEVSPGGTTVLAISRVAGGTETSLGRVTLPFILHSNELIHAEFAATGANPVTIRGRAWVDGSAEPDWQYTTTDSSSSAITAAGSVGVWEYSSSALSGTINSFSSGLLVIKGPNLSSGPTPIPGSGTSSSPTPTPTASTTPPPAPTPTPTPTSTPAPTDPAPVSVSSPTDGRGSVPVGDAAYPIPAGAIFADGSNGSDSNPGTLSAPFRTVQAAINAAHAGGTVVIRAGVYNESITVPYNKPLTIQAYPHEAVWFDGSVPVTNWVQAGNDWVANNWNYQFSSNLDGVPDNPSYVGSQNPAAGNPDQVFYDGAQLQQVLNSSAVGPGQFAVNYSAHTITIGSNPNGHALRASNLGQAINVVAPNSTLQGFGVRRYATGYDQRGTVMMQNVNSLVRDLEIVDNATIGLTISNTGGAAQRVTAEDNGLLGIGVNADYGLSITDSIVDGNNSQHFNNQPVSGGIKVTQSRGVTISNNDVSNNNSMGIWFDQSDYGLNVSNNTANNDGQLGILVEISQNAIVANNQVDNSQNGIWILDSGAVQIFNNEVSGNTVTGVRLGQDSRRQTNPGTYMHDHARPDPDPTVPWLTKNIMIANNVFGPNGSFDVYSLDGETNIPADQMGITITGNVFAYNNPANSTMVGWGQGDDHTEVSYNTPAALAAAKGPGWQNIQSGSGGPTLSAVSPMAVSGSSIATPLPSDVAAAVGQAAGVQHIGQF